MSLTPTGNPLTEEQIEEWRRFLLNEVGVQFGFSSPVGANVLCDMAKAALASARPEALRTPTAKERIAAVRADQAGAPISTAEAAAGLSKIVMDAMVDRFLSWRLPQDFSPDCGITFKPHPHPNAWPIGTNLLNADQARKMLEHVLACAVSPLARREGEAPCTEYCSKISCKMAGKCLRLDKQSPPQRERSDG